MSTLGETCLEPITLAIDDAFGVALQLHQQGRLDEAEILYRKILASAPQHLDTLHFYGVLCHQQQRYEEAAVLIQRIITAAPENADAHNNLGNVLEGMDRLHDAEACYRKAVALNPDHAPALNNLGVILAARRAMDEALDAYGRAVRFAPDHADFRYNLANALRKSGQIDEAVAAYRKAVDLDPIHTGAWQGLSRTLIKAERLDEATRIFEQWLEKDPRNPIALYHQAACLGLDAPDRAPDAFVQKTFDEMAGSFDEHLQGKLDYQAPQLLTDALAAVLPPPNGALDVLDAGCGTGLCGPLLRLYAHRLVGVDLSAGMLVRAKGVCVYDELLQAELTEFLKSLTGAYDIIVSADTLCYFGDLEPVTKAAADALKPGGFFAFSLERADPQIENWQLNPHGRYAHSKRYTQKVLERAGFHPQSFSAAVLRNEGGKAVGGHIVVVSF